MSKPAEIASQITASTYHAVAVRSDHWDAILEFINAQDIVVSAASPRHLYPVQAISKDRLKPLKTMVDQYKHADDHVEIEVELNGGVRQKTWLSLKALSAQHEAGEILVAASHNNDERPTRHDIGGATKPSNSDAGGNIVDGTRVERIARQSKTAIQKTFLAGDIIHKSASKDRDTHTSDSKRSKSSSTVARNKSASSTTKSPKARSPPEGTTAKTLTSNRTRAALTDDTNKHKHKPASESKPTSDTSNTPRSANAATKRKVTTADETVNSLGGVVRTSSKRQRFTKEVEPTERSAKKLATKPTLTKKTEETKPKLPAELIKGTSVEATSPSAIVDKASITTSPVDVDDKTGQDSEIGALHKFGATLSSSDVDQDKTDAAVKPSAKSIEDTVSVPEPNLKTSGITKKLSSPILDTPGTSEEKKGVAKIVKRAWRSTKISFDLIDGSFDKKETEPKNKATSTRNLSDESCKAYRDVERVPESAKDRTDVSPSPSVEKKSKDVANSLTKKASIQKSWSGKTVKNGDKTKKSPAKGIIDDLQKFIQENLDEGLILDEPRRKPVVPRAQKALSTSTPSPSPSSSVPGLPSPTRSKRKHAGSIEDNYLMKKIKKSAEKVKLAEKSRAYGDGL
ncbi:hypothetical protein N0V95_005853 [Ascochyta clinopodiicola]|nr:hypothetical protein N0V95_005853 [Ascochyta clinopodiicola]